MTFDPATLVRDYGDPYAEARRCRSAAALFDFSFVARGRVRGARALAVLAELTQRRLGDMAAGQIRYALRSDAHGRLAADLTIWRDADGAFEVMSGRRQDIADLVRLAPEGTAEDLSEDTSIFAVQGPRALDVMAAAGLGIREGALGELRYYRFLRGAFAGSVCHVGRLGYTGEAGFEIVVPRPVAPRLWARLAETASPAGFAAADILRIEAGFVLFANEFRVGVTAAEAGLTAFDAVAPSPASAGDITLIAFTAETASRPLLWQPSGSVVRPGPGEVTVTSACWSPHLGSVLGLGYARVADLAAAVTLSDPSGRFAAIRRAARPAFDTGKRRPRAAWGR